MDPIVYAFGVAVVGRYVYWVDAGDSYPADAPRVGRIPLDGSSPAEVVATYRPNAALSSTTSVGGEIWLLGEDFPGGQFSLVQLDPSKGQFDPHPIEYQVNGILAYDADLIVQDAVENQILD